MRLLRQFLDGRSGGFLLASPASGVLVGSVVALIALLCWVCFFNGLDILFPLDKTEALQLSLADSMAVTGNWVIPTIDNLPYFDKPPLPYWFGAFLLQGGPQQLWLPRLGAGMAGCLGVAATLVLVRFGSAEARPLRQLSRAAVAAAVLALTPAYVAFSRTAVHDIYLTASITTTLAVVFLLAQASTASARLQIGAGGLVGISLGLGVLAKGLLSLGLPLATAVIFLAVAGSAARRPFTWRFGLALLLALLAVALPWHLAAWQAQGSAFIDNYVIRTHLHRLATELDDHAGPWFFYLLAYPGLTAPWSLLAAAALIKGDCLRLRGWRRLVERDPLLLFCAIWIGITVVLFSLVSTKLPHYILSSLPPTAIAASYFLVPPGSISRQQSSLGQPSRGPRQVSRVLLAATAVVLLLTGVVLASIPELLIPLSRRTPNFSLALRGQLSSLPVVAGLLLLAAVGGWAAWRHRRPQHSLGALWAACLLSFLLFQAPPVLQIYRQTVQDPRLAMATQALQQAGPDEPIALIGQAWYSIKLHTQGRVEILNRGKAFGAANDGAAARACSRAGLLMGPTGSVEKTIAKCPSGSFTLLAKDTAAQLSLVRWQPQTPSV